MDRKPSYYSRLLVLAGLVPLLLLDLAGVLPDGGFVGGGAIVLALAGSIHFYGGERRAAAGWVLFGAALALVALVDVMDDTLYFAAFIALLVAGLLFLASEHTVGEESTAE